MNRLLTYLIILIVAAGCGQNNEQFNKEIILNDKPQLMSKYNPFDEVFLFDPSELLKDGFISDTTSNGNLTYTRDYDTFKVFFNADKSQKSIRVKGLEFMLDTVSVEKSVIDSYEGDWYFDVYAKLPFDTTKADKIMNLFNLKRQIPNTEGWLTYTDKDSIEFTLVFGYWVDGSKSIAMRQLLSISKENFDNKE